MKKAIAMACALCMAIAILSGAAFAAALGGSPAGADQSGSTELLPVDVINDPSHSEIRKVYELSPGMDPSRLPRDRFERGGYAYECTDILREVLIGEESKTVTVTETAESKKDDMSTVLSLYPQNMGYSDEDGFAGNLLLNIATIKSEVAGYGSYSTPYTVSRNYPNLANADTQYLPKTVDDNGRTLQLQDVQWQTDNFMNVDDYDIGDRYTAIVTYGGSRTSSYVTGYIITADYSGAVTRKGVTAIKYTVIFAGTEIPAPEPVPEPVETELEPEPVEPPVAPPAQTSAQKISRIIWLPIVSSILSLLGCGACAYMIIKNRKETPRYDKVPDYDYPDPYDHSLDNDAGNGDGDGERP